MNILEQINKYVLFIALFRFLSGMIEITAGLIMLKFNMLSKALLINSLLAIVGPTILVLTTTIGVVGLQDKLSISSMFFITLGVFFIIYGVKN